MARGKIVFRTLHIKFGLVKQYINALDKEKDCFRCLCSSLAGLTEKKLKAGIFDGPQIRKMIRDEDFTTSVTNIEKRAWPASFDVVNNFLGNRKAENYMEVVNVILSTFELQSCNMSIKVNFLFSHLGISLKTLMTSVTSKKNIFTKTSRSWKNVVKDAWTYT